MGKRKSPDTEPPSGPPVARRGRRPTTLQVIVCVTRGKAEIAGLYQDANLALGKFRELCGDDLSIDTAPGTTAIFRGQDASGRHYSLHTLGGR